MMSSDDLIPETTPARPVDPGPERVRLKGGGAILLEASGFRIIPSRGLKRSPLQPYESLTHVSLTERALLVATTSGLTIVRARDFQDPDAGPAATRQALLEHVAARPEGEAVLAQIARLEAFSHRKSRSYAVWGVIALCVLATLAQLHDPMVEYFASFNQELFGRGELWRAVTAHFLHGAPTVPIHLAVNVGGLLVLGQLVERPLGTLRTVVVLGLGGVGTILGSLYYGYEDVVGSSGLVSALAGAILALELHYPESVPAYWRLPRRLFLWALAIQFLVIDQLFSSFLAGGAHLGGFAGGYVAAWMIGDRDLEEADPGPSLRLAALGAVSLLIIGIVTAVPLARHDMGALERHAMRLLDTRPALQSGRVQHDNAVAWFIATEGEPTPGGLGLAVALADRAVAATGRRDPNVLDTLAEALFQAGDPLGALMTIDEAIRLAPNELYYREQRRRFTGDRAADDRPTPPGTDEGSGFGLPFGPESDALPIDPDAPSITL